MHYLAESVNKHKNASILVWICDESEDEVHWNGIPALFQDKQRLQRGKKGRTRLHLMTEYTGLNVPAHELVLMGREKSRITVR